MMASSGFSEALGVLHQAMLTALHPLIAMVIEMASNLHVFFVVVDSAVAHNGS
jgi:hypothetical protein